MTPRNQGTCRIEIQGPRLGLGRGSRLLLSDLMDNGLPEKSCVGKTKNITPEPIPREPTPKQKNANMLGPRSVIPRNHPLCPRQRTIINPKSTSQTNLPATQSLEPWALPTPQTATHNGIMIKPQCLCLPCNCYRYPTLKDARSSGSFRARFSSSECKLVVTSAVQSCRQSCMALHPSKKYTKFITNLPQVESYTVAVFRGTSRLGSNKW